MAGLDPSDFAWSVIQARRFLLTDRAHDSGALLLDINHEGLRRNLLQRPVASRRFRRTFRP